MARKSFIVTRGKNEKETKLESADGNVKNDRESESGSGCSNREI